MGLWWCLVGCNNFLFYYFQFFYFLFSNKLILEAGHDLEIDFERRDPLLQIIFRGGRIIRHKNYIFSCEN
jgi:hypothetical protein